MPVENEDVYTSLYNIDGVEVIVPGEPENIKSHMSKPFSGEWRHLVLV